MVKSRAPWSVGLFAVAVGCTVANPLFILPDDGSGGGSDGSTTDTGSATGTTASTIDPTATTSGVPASCGDGVPDPGEQCDDADADNTDDCIDTCKLAVCGDTYTHAGVEACDDGNQTPGDGCEANCQPLFPELKDTQTIAPGANAVAVGEFDDDDRDDVALSFTGPPCSGNGANCVRIYSQSTNFDQPTSLEVPLPVPALNLLAAQLDSMPGSDLAFAESDNVYVYFGGTQQYSFSMLGDESSLAAADIDGAPPLDLLMVDPAAGVINYALADGVGFVKQDPIQAVKGAKKAAFADIDGKGKLDLVFTASMGADVGLYIDLEHDGLMRKGPFKNTKVVGADALTLGDFAVVDKAPSAAFFADVSNSATLQIFRNPGTDDFTEYVVNIDVDPMTRKLLSPSLNSATDANLVAMSQLKLQIFTFVDGIVAGGFAFDPKQTVNDMAAGDLNNDGKVDLVVAGQNTTLLLRNLSK